MNPDPTQFEEPILQLRRRIEETTAAEGDPDQLAALEAELTKLADEIYANLTPWQKTLVARHPLRPYTLDFIGYLFDEWTEIHGDRKFSDDPAIVAGFARFRGTPCYSGIESLPAACLSPGDSAVCFLAYECQAEGIRPSGCLPTRLA